MSTIILEVETKFDPNTTNARLDSYCSGYISERREGVLTDGAIFYSNISEERAHIIAKLYISGFDENEDAWWRPQLVECKPVGPTEKMIIEAHEKWKPGLESRWFVKIKKPATD